MKELTQYNLNKAFALHYRHKKQCNGLQASICDGAFINKSFIANTIRKILITKGYEFCQIANGLKSDQYYQNAWYFFFESYLKNRINYVDNVTPFELLLKKEFKYLNCSGLEILSSFEMSSQKKVLRDSTAAVMMDLVFLKKEFYFLPQKNNENFLCLKNHLYVLSGILTLEFISCWVESSNQARYLATIKSHNCPSSSKEFNSLNMLLQNFDFEQIFSAFFRANFFYVKCILSGKGSIIQTSDYSKISIDKHLSNQVVSLVTSQINKDCYSRFSILSYLLAFKFPHKVILDLLNMIFFDFAEVQNLEKRFCKTVSEHF